MKLIYMLTTVLFLNCISLTAQTTTDVVTGLNNPAGIVLNGNDLYIAEFDRGKIIKIDITATTPTATDVVTGLSGPWHLIIDNNILYITESTANKVSKLNLSALSLSDLNLDNVKV